MVATTRSRWAGVCLAALAASGLADAQIQSGVPRKAAAAPVALGVPAVIRGTQRGAAAGTPSIAAASAPSIAAGSSVGFASGRPALAYPAADLPTANGPVRREAEKSVLGAATATATASPDKQFAPAPGVIRANMPPVTVDDAQRALKARAFPANLNQGAPAPSRTVKPALAAPGAMKIAGDASPLAPASIAELARSLRYHPDLIYQYVRNNIEYYPTFGVQKGALGAVLDNQGTAHDQAMLMVELLRASGYTASYVRGIIRLTAAQVQEWYGVDTANVCGVLGLLGQGQIPIYAISAASAGNCPGLVSPLAGMSVEHIWVKVNIDGTSYVFDPSYKPHSFKTGIDLATAAGYEASNYLRTAQSGALTAADYVQDVNRDGIRFTLANYASTLAGYLRTFMPAAALDDVIGGKTITPFYGALRQTALPYQDTAWGSEEFADLPSYFKPTLRVQYQGIDQTYTSDALYGRRLTITYNGANQPVLQLDGVAVGNPGTAVTPGSSAIVNFTVTHNAYTSTWANHSFSQKIKGGGSNTFLIANAWGPAGRGPARKHQDTVNALRAAGVADTSESLLGSTLAVIGAQWIAQNTQAGAITERIADTTLLHQHQVGIVGYTNAAYVDLPSNVLAVANLAGRADKESAAFANWAMHLSILESTAVQQTTNVSAVSTVKLIDIASAARQRIYNATSANYASAVQPNLVNCGAHLANFSNYLASGLRLILPARCDLGENGWSGAGYFTVGSNLYLGAIISDGLSGGLPTSSVSPSNANAFGGLAMQTFGQLNNVGRSAPIADPIDMVQGNFLYEHEDISVGVGGFPQSLAFRRLYSSGLRNRNGSLGKGWTHNFDSSATVNSDGFQAMGEDSALDAVGALVENKVSFDLLMDSTRPLFKLVAAAIGQRWFGDQLVNNTVVVTQGLNGEVFVKLADGTYNPPPGKSVKLTKNSDNSYSYDTVNRAVLKFNSAGKAESYTEPSGIQVKYSYSGNDLVSVTNSLGRTLSFTIAGGRITQVGDGTRSIGYGTTVQVHGAAAHQ